MKIMPAALVLLLGCSTNDGEMLPDPLAAGWKGSSVCETVIDDEWQRILRCTFPPGVGHERHYHPPHVGYALSGGRMQLTEPEGVRTADIKTGDSYTSEGVAWHEVLNVGNTTVQYLMIEVKRR